MELKGKKGLYNLLVILATILAFAYIFWGQDIIPDAIGTLGITPSSIMGFVDDAAAIILLIFVLSKWRQALLGTKEKPGIWGWKGKIIFFIISVFVLLYAFWIVDIIPDTIPYLGYADDAVALILGIYIFGKITRKIRN